QYEFPRDHLPHPDFKTEWWYFTGNLQNSAGRRFGYQLTFFRSGMRPPGNRGGTKSRFVVDDLKFAHFAVTDVQTKRFRFQQKLSRGAFDEAGFIKSEPSRLAWIDDWTMTMVPAGGFHIAAKMQDVRIALQLAPTKSWIAHGTDGISQKAAGEGHASHYYSGTRLGTGGEIEIAGEKFAVRGESWFDHEWATNQLTPQQVGWDWFSLQLDDGSELMLYQIRLRDGSADPHSSGTFIAKDGTTRHLQRDDYTLKPLAFWQSKATPGRYPVAWELAVPSLDLRAKITTPVEAQELELTPIAYWEGVIDLQGTRAGARLRGHGYMELTGYAGALVGLSTSAP
ncbi:MAG TPA: lipocalin-like domain-containing protein, partial [Chthoniobacteraceae bacterium]|nr:lipocalin-like domain-containing protein [Chthoniobacteraceae bacterium]